MKPGNAATGAVIALALGLAAIAVLFTWGGLTHRKSWPLEAQLGNTAVGLSARLHGGNARNPVAETPSSLNIGQTAYRACAQCHGAAGDGQADLGLAVYPPASNLLAANVKQMKHQTTKLEGSGMGVSRKPWLNPSGLRPKPTICPLSLIS